MALPPRLKSAVKPLGAIAAAVTPTGIGVLISVGAHGALLAFGPRTNFSFAALSQAAQEASAEETIVPLVELSPAERGRLPEFAQPRRQPPSLTGLSSLPLPSGIPFSNNATRIQRKPVAANKLPSTGTSQPLTRTGGKIGSINTVFPPSTFNIAGLNRQPVPKPSLSSGTGNPGFITLDQIAPPPTPPAPSDSSSNSDDPLPTLDSDFDPNETITTAQALDGLQARGNTEPSLENPEIPNIPTGTDSEEGQSIEIPEGPLDIATAQGVAAQLAEDTIAYNDAVTTDEEVEQRIEGWYAETAEGKEQVAQATTELSVDSGFKACRELPPTDGLIGVLVNPDGSQENITILKSSGYDVVNRSALSRLSYEDFGKPAVPTQYEIEMKVIYEPEDCVEDLPEAVTEE